MTSPSQFPHFADSHTAHGHGKEPASPAANAATTPRPACACSRLTWPRRWHALAGGLVMLFLVIHLAACALGLNPEAYAQAVGKLEALLNLAPTFFLAIIFLPFLFQISTGVFLLNHHGLKYNVSKCNRGGKPRFFGQRITGIMILLFLIAHVATLHAWGLHSLYQFTHWPLLERYAAGGLFAPNAAFGSTVQGLRQSWNPGNPLSIGNLLLALLTLLGALSAAFHAGNGTWSGGFVWGLARTPRQRKMLGWGAVLAVIFFAVAACAAWWAFTFSASARAQIP